MLKLEMSGDTDGMNIYQKITVAEGKTLSKKSITKDCAMSATGGGFKLEALEAKVSPD